MTKIECLRCGFSGVRGVSPTTKSGLAGICKNTTACNRRRNRTVRVNKQTLELALLRYRDNGGGNYFYSSWTECSWPGCGYKNTHSGGAPQYPHGVTDSGPQCPLKERTVDA
jgi:hypothetical protein